MVDKNKNKAFEHCHTEFSQFDGTGTIEEYCKRVAELNPDGMIAITDHGNLMVAIDAFAKVKEFNEKNGTNIKYVPGVELYVEEDDAAVSGRSHLVVFAKNNKGFDTISAIVTKSNERLDAQGFPRANYEMLNSVFGSGKPGHGNVIATSACMLGAVNNILLRNHKIDKDIKKLESKKTGLYNPDSEIYKKNKAKLESMDARVVEIRAEIETLNKVSKKSYLKREKAVAAAEGTADYETLKAALVADKKESEDAAKRIESLKAERVEINKKSKELRERLKTEEKSHERWFALQNEIDRLSTLRVPRETLEKEAKEELIKYQTLFGKENFFVELQYHRIPEEAECFPVIAKLAKELNIPLIAANDAHMPRGDKASVKRRQITRSLRYNTWEEVSDSDFELYLKSDDELRLILSEILPEEYVNEAIENVYVALEQCNVNPAPEEHYPKFKSPIEGESSYEYLVRIANEGIEWRYPKREGWTKEHEERLAYELEVINKLNVCDYLAIVEDFLRYGRLLGRIDLNDPRYKADPYNITLLEELAEPNAGLGIGPGRGSAVGSLVCYLIGITGIDPMKYNLVFERFLNTERVTMPDIDSDFKPDIREKVLEYVKHKYGKHAVCCIMTKGTQQARAAVRNCARLLGDEKFGDTSKFLSLGDQITKEIPTELNIKLDDCWDDLVEKFKDNENAMEILNNAKLVEGTFYNIGMHAAGVIIADNGDVSEYVPLMYNKAKGQWLTQCDKDQCEPLGLLKMDFLGLKNLGIITETLRTVQERTGKKIDIERVPLEKEVFQKIFAAGMTNSVFQFESSGMKQMLRNFRPDSIEDIILLVAAYRPGPMQFLDDIIAVKKGEQKPSYVIPEMETILGQTYGYPVYQEQIMQIFNKFAGFSLGESDIIRRYMSKKKTEKFMAYKDKFVEGMIARGGKKQAVEDFWDQLLDFSRYAFNKSHAAAYAFVAYYTAWLKYHYPTEYLCAVMNTTEFDKIGSLIGDCKDFGIKVRPVNINKSKNEFSVDGNEIVLGFSNLKGVGSGAEEIIEERKKGSFKNFSDFMVRLNPNKKVIEALIKAGAFDEFSNSRMGLLNAVPEFQHYLKRIVAKEAVVSEESDSAKGERAKAALETLKEGLSNISVDTNADEDPLQRLLAEKEVSGSFISGHPLDLYKQPTDCSRIGELVKGEKKIIGIVSDLRISFRKTDGQKMAFFKLEDRTGSIDVSCFTAPYKEFGNLIQENAVLIVSGKVTIESAFNATDDDEEELVLKFTMRKAEKVEPDRRSIVLKVPNMGEWAESIYKKVKPYQNKDGFDLVLFDELCENFRETEMTVSKDLMDNPSFSCWTV